MKNPIEVGEFITLTVIQVLLGYFSFKIYSYFKQKNSFEYEDDYYVFEERKPVGRPRKYKDLVNPDELGNYFETSPKKRRR